MKVDNSLSREFLLRYPVEAARVLEQVSAESVADLFDAMSVEIIAPVIVAMLPNMVAACLQKMEIAKAATLLTEISVDHAARIYRLLPGQKQEQFSALFPDKRRRRIRRFLQHASLSAGDLMDSGVNMLPEDLTVVEAIRRIEKQNHSVGCEIYIVNKAHQLMGVIELGELLNSSHHVRLHDIMTRLERPLSVRAAAEKLPLHPAWEGRQRLPVVESDNTLVGVLELKRVLEATGEGTVAGSDSMESLVSLAGLYWLSASQLLDIFFSSATAKKGGRK